MPIALVVKNGSSCPAQRFAIHSLTRIGHTEADVAACIQSTAVTIGDPFLPSGYHDLAAIGHGIASIYREIEQRHFKLVGVGVGRHENERETGFYLDRWAKRSLKKVRHPAHEFGNARSFPA